MRRGKRNIYATHKGKLPKGTTLKQELKELRKTIKDTLAGKISANWFNRNT